MLKSLADAGRRWLEQHMQLVNDLNVFPVPDGDTGTNMLLTMNNAYREIAEDDSPSAAHIADRLAHGAIMGSRGNSGTIMSQIWVGLAEGLRGLDTFDVTSCAGALQKAADRAYQGVQNPVEGTILTIIREVAEEAALRQAETDDLANLLEHLVRRGWEAVDRTPDLLPVLRDAGVKDSGGTGLVYVLEGMLRFTRGESFEVAPSLDDAFEQALSSLHTPDVDLSMLADEQYNYDVQFIIKGAGLDVQRIKTDIEAMGDSGVIIGNEMTVKVHIHVDDPSQPIGYGVRLGALDDVVVENMQLQYEALLAKQGGPPEAGEIVPRQVSPGEIGVIAVAPGRGLARVLAVLGAAAIIDGGQTNNPSTEEILAAAQELPTETVFILPNNKNIILAAEQAARMSQNQTVRVLPTRTFPQGVAALVAYQADADPEMVFQDMHEAKDEVITCEVTTATRSVELDGVAVRDGQSIGLIDGQLRHAADDPLTVLFTLLDDLDLDMAELVTIYYGADVSRGQVQEVREQLAARYPELEFEAVYGGQPHYQFILSIE